MDNKSVLTHVLACLGGAAVGGGLVWFIANKTLSKKYADIAQEEIDSVKAKFTIPKDEVEKFIKAKRDSKPSEATLAHQSINKPSIAEYAKKIQSYTNYSNVDYEPERAHFEPATNEKPYVISPEEFGEDEEYEQQELTLYADGILADEDDTVLNSDEVVGGEENLSHIGDYEDDAVHIKNVARKVYYEVLIDNRSYEDATGKKPPVDEED